MRSEKVTCHFLSRFPVLKGSPKHKLDLTEAIVLGFDGTHRVVLSVFQSENRPTLAAAFVFILLASVGLDVITKR